MFFITKKDKNEILQILIQNKGKCKLDKLVEEYSYLNDKKTKQAKIREIIKVLNKELNQVIRMEIVAKYGLVEIVYF